MKPYMFIFNGIRTKLNGSDCKPASYALHDIKECRNDTEADIVRDKTVKEYCTNKESEYYSSSGTSVYIDLDKKLCELGYKIISLEEYKNLIHVLSR